MPRMIVMYSSQISGLRTVRPRSSVPTSCSTVFFEFSKKMI
jgi:hypothetical protein